MPRIEPFDQERRIEAALGRLLASVFVALLLLAVPRATRAEGDPAASNLSRDRLVRVAKLWGVVRYLHPYSLAPGVDLDAALIRALPRVRNATDTAAYREAVAGLLAELGDPLSRVVERRPEETGTAGDGPASHRVGETLVVDLGALLRLPSAARWRELKSLDDDLTHVTAVVLDLRTGGSELLGLLAPRLTAVPLVLPSQRFVECSGFPGELEGLGEYYCGFVQRAAATVQPGGGNAPRRVVFMISGSEASLPELAIAMRSAGSGVILSEDPTAATEKGGASRAESSGGTTWTLDVGEGVEAQVRVSELMLATGSASSQVDVRVPMHAPGAADAAMTEALAAAGRPPVPGTPIEHAQEAGLQMPVSPAVAHRLASYPSVDDASQGLDVRQFAVIRAWTIIHLFYPYLDLIGDWDSVLPTYLDRIKGATTKAAYASAMAEMMTHVPDGHVFVNIDDQALFNQIYGSCEVPPIRVRRVEGLPVVTAVGPTATGAQVALGDVIEEVDGVKASDKMKAGSRLMTASNAEILADEVASLVLCGESGHPAQLLLRDVHGERKRVQLPRDPALKQELPKGRHPGGTVQILPDNIGYVDLTQLVIPEVDAMFEKLKDTRAIVFDMRGYPNGTAWTIAPRLGVRDQPVAALFRRSVLSGFSQEETQASHAFAQRLPPPPPGKWRYQRPTVMLIDDRAISQAEHTGLFFEAANDTRFVGSPTAGANGDVSAFLLPGGLSVTFTGHEVRHADGRQLQRVGLQPDVAVVPTIAGIAAGRDEVLERAVRYVEEHTQQTPDRQR